MGRVGSAVSRFFHVPEIRRVYDDLREEYDDRMDGTQSTKAIVVTYLLGGLLTEAAATIVLAPFVLPFVFGYYVREMGRMIHGRDAQTFLQNPLDEDRPTFSEPFSLAVDGIKFGAVFLVYCFAVFEVFHVITATLDLFQVDLITSVTYGGGIALVVALAGTYVIPVFLARFAHTGSLVETFENPGELLGETLLDGDYVVEFIAGSLILTIVVGVVAFLANLSLLFVELVGGLILFLGWMEALDHFAKGYRSALGIENTVVDVPADRYALPLREGGVMSPTRSRSIGVVGETGSGKTEAIKLLAHQFGDGTDDPVMVFDYKSDYADFFDRDRGPSVAADGGTDSTEDDGGDSAGEDEEPDLVRLSTKGSTHTWNVFREVDDESEFEEIGRALFKHDEENTTNSYFPKAARQVAVASMKYVYRVKDDPTNADLVRLLQQNGIEDLYALLTREGHEDLRGAASNIDPEARRQAAGVYGHLQTVMQEVFTGDFTEEGSFSVREYMRDPDGRTLLLDFPIDQGERVKPAFRFFIDWAIRHALDDRERDAYFVLDEFQALPGLERIERLVNAGRARGAYGILGLQSKAQLDAAYGEAEADSILSGLTQEVLLRPGDQATVEYVRNRIGREQRVRRVQGPASWFDQVTSGREVSFSQTTTEEEHAISEAELQRFAPGEAIVLVEQGWRRGTLYLLEQVRDLLDQRPAVTGTHTVDAEVEIDEGGGTNQPASANEDDDEDAFDWSDLRVQTFGKS